jgi:4-hydroxymandelate oxidase
VTPLRLVHPEAELAAARAAAAAGTILVCGSESHHSIGEIAAAGATCWFQLYPLRDRAVTERLVREAEAAGCRALVLTVNAAYEARRERGMRRPFAIPPEVRYGNFVGIGEPGQSSPIDLRAQPLTWTDLAWLRSISTKPLVLKGIVTAEDAALAVERGVEAIIVSNHGGRQLDGAVATLEALPEVVAAVRSRCEIFLDGGVRRGTDIVKALALGARAVLIGRPYVWGLAVAGEAGVRSVLEMLRAELDSALAQLGRPDLAALDRSAVRAAGGTTAAIDPPATPR